MAVVQSGHELFVLLKSLLGEQHNDGWACPWCKELGVYKVEDESTSNRLFLSSRIEENRHPIRFICRQAYEGVVQHHPVHSVEELFEFKQAEIELAPGKTWLEIANQLLAIVGISASQKDIDKSKAFWNFEQVFKLHKNPNTYPEWEKVGVTKPTIDRLFLGVDSNGRLTIPIPYLAPDPLQFGLTILSDSYVQRSRRAEGVETGKKYMWPEHLPATLWYIPQKTKSGDETPCKLVEGDSSAIAALEIWGDGPIATTTAGAGSWSLSMSEYLLARGHTEFYILYDNDKPGKKYADHILEKFKEAADKRHVDWGDLSFSLIHWPEDKPEGYDPRAALKEYGVERSRELLEKWVEETGWFSMRQPLGQGRVHAVWDGEYAKTDFKTDNTEAKSKLYNLEALRGNENSTGLIYQEIGDFVAGYKKEEDDDERGKLLLIRSTPGVGKTRSAIRFAEDFARFHMARRQKAAARRLEQLQDMEQTEEVQRKIEALKAGQYKKLTVFFIGPYIDGWSDIEKHSSDISLWYNFEARNTETCKNFPLTKQVVNAGYGIMKTCCIEDGLCPLRQQCLGKVDGKLQYLAQMDEINYHPIVYLRHNHLYMKEMLSRAKLIIVDEDPSAVSLSSVTLALSDLKKFNAHLMLEGEDAEVANSFMEAFINAVELWSPANNMLMGRRLIDRIKVTSGFRTLHELAVYIQTYGLIDKIVQWKPKDFNVAPHGKLVDLLALLVFDVLRSEEDWNGQIFIEGNAVTFYPMQAFEVAHNKPIVALDATGIAHKYQLAFNRSVLEFFAEVYPENARTFVVTNTENTMNTLHEGIPDKNIPISLFGVRDNMTLAVKAKPQNYVVLDKNVPNVAMREVIRMSLGLTAKHGQLLVVTYKLARMYIEDFIRNNFPEYYPYMAFGHFRALRGLNAFESMPAVLVAGTFRVPVTVLQKDLIAFHKNDPELLNLKVQRSYEFYHHTPWAYPTLTVADARDTVQEYINELEAGEIQQVAGRIRAAVSDEKKYIYLMTSRPAMLWHTYVESEEYDPKKDRHFSSAQSASWWWFEAEQAMSHIVRFQDQYGRMPSIVELMEMTGHTRHTVIKMLDFWNNFYEE